MPKDTTTKTTGNVTVDETIPVREGYIFTGWAYSDGNATTLYQGGATFVAPIHDVELKAQWVKTSEQINYKVNDAKMGSVSRTYERVQAGKTAKGSIARANSGYVFVNWTDEENNVVSTDSSYIPEKTDPATYTANFKAKKSSLIIHYTDDKGNKIREDDTEQIAFGKEWSVDAPEIKGYKQPSEKTQSGTKKDETEEITFFYTQKEGKVVYNLGPKGSWGNGSPENVVVFDAAKGKWAYNYGFDKGDTFVVTDSVPTSSDNAVFVGWYDKERGTTPAAMRTAREKVTYPYTEASNTNTYTLDALWEKLQGANKVLPYDGKEHSLDEFTVKFANENLQGWKDSASSLVQASNIQYRLKQDGREVNEWGAMPSFKDAGVYTIEAKAIVNGVELTAEATLTITKAPLTVKTEGATRAYNGQPLTAPGTVTGFVEGENAELQVTGKQTDVGSSKNTYNIVWTETTKADNYQVSETVGTLTVTAQSIDPGTDPEKPNPDYTGAKVNSPSDKVYDGKEHKWIPTVTDKADKKLKAGTDYTVEYSTSDFTNVGTIKVTITGKGNYSGTVKRSYKVTPKEYTVTTDSATKTYSGTALTAGGKVEGIVSGETVEFTTTGSQTEVGTSKNTYELVWKSAKATNYTLVKESIGTLTVKAKSIVPDGPDTPDEKKTGITVNEPSDSKYDGKEHKEVLTVTDTKTGKELVAGTDYSVTYSSDLVNAGTVKVTVAGLGNYSGSFTKTYKITKRSVTLTSATVSKVYDGSALTNTDIAVSGDGFVEGEGASYEVTGSQTEVGNSANSFEYKLNEKTLASNYNITKVVGTLTITAAPAPVTPATPSTPSSTTSTTPRTPSAPQVTTPAETVEKETTPKAEPKKEEKVEEEYTPKASPQYYWALINLICAILTVLF